MSRVDDAPGLPELDYELLRRAILDRLGIDYPPHKRDLLRLRLAGRLRALGLRRFADYYRVLQFGENADDEWMAVANAVTNNETCFFRERHQFEQLGALLPAHSGQRPEPLRVLSAGCSSGEEAYSLAMILAHLLAGRRPFQVTGVDVSTAKLDEGRRARYSPRSMREGKPPCGLELAAYLEVDNDGTLRASRALQAMVSFRWTNLADPRVVAPLGAFEVVFCRNVLMYADATSLPRFHAALERLVAPGGHLFIGHAESLINAGTSFVPTRVGDHFAYVRR